MSIRKLKNFFQTLNRQIQRQLQTILKQKLSRFFKLPYKISYLLLIYLKKLLRATINLKRHLRKFTLAKRNSQRYRRIRKPLPLSGWLRPFFQQRWKTSGFVLPTLIMVLLVFSLVVSAILLRTSSYTQQTIGSREAQETYNIATPAMERAKSKLEFLFRRDDRLALSSGGTLPNGKTLQDLLLNSTAVSVPEPYKDENGSYLDIYTLPDEVRIDIDGNNVVDNAWAYNTDLDGDGTSETVAYSIFTKNQVDDDNNGTPEVTLDSSDVQKANKFVTRTGPMTIQNNSSIVNCVLPGLQVSSQDDGWYPINTASVRKNFQINAVVVNPNDANKVIASLEFQQDRQLDLGNKWGVWFRYDLEAYPGPTFNWNGAMHTDGNIIWGDTGGGTGISTYLISSPQSCLYTEDASEITMSQNEDRRGRITFQGQVINGNPTPDNFAGTSEVDIFPGAGLAPDNGPPDTNKVGLTVATDSVKDSLEPGSGVSPYTYSLDPIPLFTEDKSLSRFTTDPTNKTTRNDTWATSDLGKRLFNKLITRPYVDDTYRADDRWGPKPLYTAQMKVPRNKLGKDIDRYVDALTKENPLPGFPEDVGLDGYWERRARLEGVRIIVGQRLELGNTFGWQGSNHTNTGEDDSLYPPKFNTGFTSLTNLGRQRRTIRDNLAAVQSTLVYHYGHDQDFPIASIASTVHPGTPTTKINSTTFKDITDTGKVNTDFLNGIGTNGWEFNPPGNVTSEADFKALIDEATDPLRIALNNLATFAGDSNGAFNPRQEPTGSTIVHPYPLLTMWGNFSELRRALTKLNGGTNYSDLSLADRTTLQTAAATIGMLAYNIQNAETAYNGGSGSTNLNQLGQHFWQLVDGVSTPGNGEVNALVSPAVSLPTGYNRHGDGNGNGVPDSLEFYAQFKPEDFIEALYNDPGLGTNKDELIERAKFLAMLGQIDRDRALGFKGGNLPAPTASTSGWNPTTGQIAVKEGGNDVVFQTSCDPSVFSDVTAGGGGGLTKQVGLALVFCPADMKPKYPSLFYLFPKYQHNQRGTRVTPYTGTEQIQPTTEEYIADTYIFDLTSSSGINDTYTYKVLKDVDGDGWDDSTPSDRAESGIDAIALQPTERTDWKLPYSTTNTNTGNGISDNGTSVYLPFLDKAFYDGRQLMQIRSMDIDLDLLKDNKVNPSANDSDWWLPKSSIVYAFREDAVREDAIARPAGSSWVNCDTATELVGSTCRMNSSPTAPSDPPLSTKTLLSTKPVDFYSDPDRRPYGFRLKNGSDVSRTGTKGGLSFISDDPVYLQGNLNLHQDDSGSRLEEFTEVLNDNWTNFYTRGTSGHGTLNSRFARSEYDHWRPVEIIGDAVTVLSNNFCDGAAEDGLRNTNTLITVAGVATNSCFSTTATSSYRNSTLASTGYTTWLRENNQADGVLDTPVRVDRNGQFYRTTNTAPAGAFTDYRTLGNNKSLNDAAETRMNALFINGLVPSRQFQSYGGLHNFPRFIENWGSDNLHMSGAFIQLSFSTYATAPWDQEAWEPGQNPVSGESIKFYSPPNRRWGYDVALQYSAPGPVASRFVSVGSPRSEFYEQIPANDPYIRQLRCSWVSGRRVDPKATDCL